MSSYNHIRTLEMSLEYMEAMFSVPVNGVLSTWNRAILSFKVQVRKKAFYIDYEVTDISLCHGNFFERSCNTEIILEAAKVTVSL